MNVYGDAVADKIVVNAWREGYPGVYDTSDPDHLKVISKVSTTRGAKTGILAADLKEIVLAVSPVLCPDLRPPRF